MKYMKHKLYIVLALCATTSLLYGISGAKRSAIRDAIAQQATPQNMLKVCSAAQGEDLANLSTVHWAGSAFSNKYNGASLAKACSAQTELNALITAATNFQGGLTPPRRNNTDLLALANAFTTASQAFQTASGIFTFYPDLQTEATRISSADTNAENTRGTAAPASATSPEVTELTAAINAHNTAIDSINTGVIEPWRTFFEAVASSSATTPVVLFSVHYNIAASKNN